MQSHQCAGFVSRVMAVPATVIYFTGYDILLQRMGKEKTLSPLLAGSVARGWSAVVCAVVTRQEVRAFWWVLTDASFVGLMRSLCRDDHLAPGDDSYQNASEAELCL